MTPLRRRRLPEELRPAFDAFAGVVEHVELAKASLTGSMPTTRFAGRPLAETLSEFEDELAAAADEMAAWRAPAIEPAWAAAARGLTEARARAERLRREAPELGGFEGLLGAISDLLAPLDAFADARDAWSSLRVRTA